MRMEARTGITVARAAPWPRSVPRAGLTSAPGVTRCSGWRLAWTERGQRPSAASTGRGWWPGPALPAASTCWSITGTRWRPQTEAVTPRAWATGWARLTSEGSARPGYPGPASWGTWTTRWPGWAATWSASTGATSWCSLCVRRGRASRRARENNSEQRWNHLRV